MKVFAVDDHDMVFSGYSNLLLPNGYELVGTSTNGEDFLDWLSNNKCDVVLLDLKMEGLSGVDILKILFDVVDAPKVIVVSGYYEISDVQDVILLGAKGFIDKASVKDELIEALRTLERGRRFFSESVLDVLIMKQLNSDVRVSLENILSEKQNEALGYLIEEMSSNEISEEMKIDRSSVRTIFQQIRYKLGVKTNIKLVSLAIKHKFNQNI